MQGNIQFKQKYKALIFLHITLFFLNGYFIKELSAYGMMLSLLLFLAILYYLIKVYKDENRLIEFAEIKHKILTTMSHEFRTPLNSVIGFSEQLSQSKLNNKQAKQLIAIRSSSIMLLELVNNILDLSKYETYKITFDKSPFVPFDVLSEVMSGIAIQANQKGVEVKSDISFKDTICCSGDPLRLKQVVMNLLSNAIKFTEKGSVTLKADVITLAENQGLLQVKIIDTGIGIAAKDLGRIFDEYYSLQGIGLGLAICKKLIELQEGEITVTSNLGIGSMFSFSIPYQFCDKITLENNPITVNELNLRDKRILLVDDHKMNILLAQTVLTKYKMLIDIAYDGAEALLLFKKTNYDLVVTDIQMPKLNGVDLSKAIRSNFDTRKQNTPILGVTANVLAEDRKAYLNAGMNDLVLKPFSENELIEKIAKQLR